MKRTFKCANNHKFKSEEDKPLCPQCSETAAPVQWNKVEFNKSVPDKSNRKIIGAALNVVTAGLLTGLSQSSSELPSDQAPGNEFKGGDGKFGGGGSSGSY